MKSPREWSGGDEENYNNVPYWSLLELLEEFAEGVSSGCLKRSAQRKGVVGKPVIDYIGLEKIVFPILYAIREFLE